MNIYICIYMQLISRSGGIEIDVETGALEAASLPDSRSTFKSEQLRLLPQVPACLPACLSVGGLVAASEAVWLVARTGQEPEPRDHS